MTDFARELLTENTGTHMLDSGGVAGRHWQQNQGRDFDAEPAAYYRADTWTRDGETKVSIEATISVYHWLSAMLEDADETVSELWGTYLEDPDVAEDHGLSQMMGFPEWLEGLGYDVQHGIYPGEGGSELNVINTYNSECALSQTLQFGLFYLNDEAVVLMQVHGGADVRGGYTDPRPFAVSSNICDAASLFCWNDMQLVPVEDTSGQLTLDGVEPAEDPSWYTDDGYHWYPNDGGENLENYPVHEFATDASDAEYLADCKGLEHTDSPLPGHLNVDTSTGDLYCPITRRRLEVFPPF